MGDANFEWYLSNAEKLFEMYGNSFIAIKDRQVIGTYSAYGEAVRNTMKTEAPGSFIVQQCGPDESAYTVCISSMNFCEEVDACLK